MFASDYMGEGIFKEWKIFPCLWKFYSVTQKQFPNREKEYSGAERSLLNIKAYEYLSGIQVF